MNGIELDFQICCWSIRGIFQYWYQYQNNLYVEPVMLPLTADSSDRGAASCTTYKKVPAPWRAVQQQFSALFASGLISLELTLQLWTDMTVKADMLPHCND